MRPQPELQGRVYRWGRVWGQGPGPCPRYGALAACSSEGGVATSCVRRGNCSVAGAGVRGEAAVVRCFPVFLFSRSGRCAHVLCVPGLRRGVGSRRLIFGGARIRARRVLRDARLCVLVCFRSCPSFHQLLAGSCSGRWLSSEESDSGSRGTQVIAAAGGRSARHGASLVRPVLSGLIVVGRVGDGIAYGGRGPGGGPAVVLPMLSGQLGGRRGSGLLGRLGELLSDSRGLVLDRVALLRGPCPARWGCAIAPGSWSSANRKPTVPTSSPGRIQGPSRRRT